MSRLVGWLVMLGFVPLLLAQAADTPGAEPAKSPAVEKPAAAHDASEDHPPRYDLGSGGKAHTSLFGVEAAGYRFVYVIDRSESMGGSGPTALKAAKAALLASLNDLHETNQFQIVFYNEKPSVFNPTGDSRRALFATEQNKAAAEKFVDSITAFDGTAHDAALMLAVRLHPDVIYWLTDADEPKLSAAQLARLERLTAGIIVNAIEFGSGPQPEGENFLVQAARQSGGTHRYVDVEKLEK